MGAGDGRNFMPDDGPGVWRKCDTWLGKREILDALGVEMNLAMRGAREALQQFGERALRAMLAINER